MNQYMFLITLKLNSLILFLSEVSTFIQYSYLDYPFTYKKIITGNNVEWGGNEAASAILANAS